MVSGKHKSRSLRRVYRKTPGGRNVVQYKKRKPGKAHCAKCKKVLAGVPQARASKLKLIPKSSRRPQRPYGGVLCSRCTRALIIQKVRQK